MRPFTAFEQKNLKFLVNHNVKFTQVEITPTGLGKGILDSTAPMRAYFLENGIHNYEEQLQGQEHKQIKQACILTDATQFFTKASFYRPNTKKGDPRMWIYGLGAHTDGNDIHVLFWHDQTLYSINITHIDIEKCYNSALITPMQDILKEINKEGNSVKRSSKKNVLFTQTPDWGISKLKSGREIVEKYGYSNEKGFKTYQNTVQCAPPNSQMLFLNVNHVNELLELQAERRKVEDIAAWRLVKLHQRLQIKHHETFWIEVENELNNGKEYFRYKQIEHTKNPNVGQFDVLLEQNIITVDLLLCRPSGHGDTYSFKIKKKGMALLFPESVIYNF